MKLRSRASLSQWVGRKVLWDGAQDPIRARAIGGLPCPFHQEKISRVHGSMTRKGFYYCFGCHAKGCRSLFACAETENVALLEAVEILVR